MLHLHWLYSQDYQYSSNLWQLVNQCCSNESTQQLDLSLALAVSSIIVLVIISCGFISDKYSFLKRIWKLRVS